MSSLAAIDTLDALDDLFDVRISKCSAEWWLRKWYRGSKGTRTNWVIMRTFRASILAIRYAHLKFAVCG